MSIFKQSLREIFFMVNIGLIGTGYLGKIHFNLLQQTEGIRFAGFYDADPQVRASLQEQAPAFHSVTDIISASDALVVVTPTSTHATIATQCLQAGKHVFIEKPATATLEEGEQLMHLAASHPALKIQVGHVERFNPALMAAVPNLQNITHVFCNRLAPFTPRGADVSVVFDVMIHDIDIVLSLLGTMPVAVQAWGQKLVSQTWDIVNARLQFESGIQVHLTASRCAERRYRITDFIMKSTCLRVDYLDKKATLFTPQTTGTEPLQAFINRHSGKMLTQELPVNSTNAIQDELAAFAQSIQSNKKVVVSLYDGVMAMKVANMVEESMNQA